MIKIVIDTNVVISALLSPNGNPAKILDLVSTSVEIQLFYSTRMLSEYNQVISYPRLRIADEKKICVIRLIEAFGILIEPLESSVFMPDETDRIFYDTARQSDALLITGNIKHYPNEEFIVSPSKFLEVLYS